MALGVGAIGAYSSMSPINAVSRMNYSVSNQAVVSEAFKESAKKVSSDPMGSIGLTNPVQYANATYNPEAAARQQEASVEANAAYNSLAGSFDGATTGYSAAREALSYQSVGSTLDLYA